MTDFQQVKQYLMKSDAVLAIIIHEIGDLDLSRRLELSTQNHFGTLVFGIIGQRNAERVTINILKNMREKYGNESPTPEQILTTPKAELEQMVNSYKKADYLISLAENVVAETLDLNTIAEKTDEEITLQLTAVKASAIGQLNSFYFGI